MEGYRSGSTERSRKPRPFTGTREFESHPLRHNFMKKVFIIFIGWFLIVNVFAVLALNRFNLKGDTAYKWIEPDKFVQEQTWDISSIHAKWDSFWYLDIAKNGYSYNSSPYELSNIVFFPLYPALIKIFSFFTLGNLILSGWMLASFFLLLSLVYLYKLVKEFHQNVDPFLPVIFLLIFPTAFFLNAVYTESLFLFLSLATFYYTLKEKYFLAGIFGLFASITRITGVLLFIPVVWEIWKRYKFRLLKIKFLPVFLMPLGTFSFLFYHYFRFGNLFLFFDVEKRWGRDFTLNKDHFAFLSNPAIVNLIFDCFFVVFALVAVFFVFRKVRVSYSLYMLATLAVALSSGTLMSIGRYILTLFPMYILLGQVKSDYLKYSWIFISILLLAVNILSFVNGYWAG